MDMEDTSLEGKRESPYRPSPDRTAKMIKEQKVKRELRRLRLTH